MCIESHYFLVLLIDTNYALLVNISKLGTAVTISLPNINNFI